MGVHILYLGVQKTISRFLYQILCNSILNLVHVGFWVWAGFWPKKERFDQTPTRSKLNRLSLALKLFVVSMGFGRFSRSLKWLSLFGSHQADSEFICSILSSNRCQRKFALYFCLKTFDHLSKSLLNCFKLDIFEEKLGNFNIWFNNNKTYVFKSFSNFNLALKNLYLTKKLN